MADIVWWLGHATTTTATIVVRSDTESAITLAGVTSDSPKTVVAAINDGIVKFTCSGLSADSSYSFTLTQGATVETGTLKTMPESGSFIMTWSSCSVPTGGSTMSYDCPRQSGSIFHVSLGDSPYTTAATADTGQVACNDTDLSLAAATNINNYLCHHRNQHSDKALENLGHAMPYYSQADDHEWPGGDWDHTIGSTGNGGAEHDGLSGLVNTQANVDLIYDKGNQARITYQLGNPANNDAGVTAEKPSEADAGTSVLVYTPTFTRWQVGDVEFILLDCIGGRSPQDMVDSFDDSDHTAVTNKFMLNPNQITWLKQVLYTTTKTFKVILSSKSLEGSPNPDTWNNYKLARNHLCDFMINATRDAADQSTYGTDDITGVLWLTGDQHTPHVSSRTTSPIMADVCACPIGAKINGTPAAVGGNRVWVSDAGQAYGELHVTPDYLEPRIVRVNGDILWKGRVFPTDNSFSYPAKSFSI